MTHNKNSMIKKKVQTILLYRDANKQIQFLLLQTNEQRGSFWQNVTGSVEPGEEFSDAALREAIEETGLDKNNVKRLIETDLLFEFQDRWGFQAREKVFVLEAAVPFQVRLDPSEHQNYKWLEKRELNEQSVYYPSNW